MGSIELDAGDEHVFDRVDQMADTAAIDLSVIVPTFQERDNVSELVRRLRDTLDGIKWEVIFVDDDSPDGTADAVREIAQQDHRVRVIQRIGRRGLSSACVEGMLASSAPYLAVIDGDLQHDETLLPRMLEALKNEDIDIVVGSRYVAGGGISEWDQSRAAISRYATSLSRLVLRADLSDPMSGFFMLRRGIFMQAVRKLSSIGFKILVDLFVSSPRPLRFKELPYQFRTRHAGESKFDNKVAWEYLLLLADKLVGHIVPVRFIAFSLVGSLGIVLHLVVLVVLLEGFGVDFAAAQTTATLLAIVVNFTLNNELTYRDMRLRGWHWLRGLVSFSIACGIGAVANIGIATFLVRTNLHWTLAALSGIAVGAVWNYVVTMVYTWKKPKHAN